MEERISMTYKPLDYIEGTTLVDVRYYQRSSTSPELFEVIYRNPVTETLDVKYEEPLADIWFLQPSKRTNQYQICQANKEDLYCVICKPSQIPKVIADEVGGEWQKRYDDNKGILSNNKLLATMCECPWVFKADFTPDVYFRLRWVQQYGRNIDISVTTSAFIDIEIDVIEEATEMRNITPMTTRQPINAITVILPYIKKCAVILLGPRPETQIHSKFHDLLHKQQKDWDWLVNHQDEFKRMIIEDDKDNKEYIADYDIVLHLFDFNDEIKLIKTAFDYINKYRPMFALSWNAPFDHQYLLHRIERLGYDPVDFFVPKDFQTKKIYYNLDNNPKAAIKTSRDWFFVSSYTTYCCQERIFAAVRKSQQEKRSLALSYIGKTIAGIDKLGDTKSTTFREFAYTDYIKFVLYNIRDVVVQVAIESKCNDMKSLLSRSYQFLTQYSKCFQETHIVRNTREYFFEKVGFVQSCRLIVDPSYDTHFKGAFVAPPDKNALTGDTVLGRQINNIIYAALDADAKAYYPSTKIGFNLDGMSLIGKCVVDNIIFRDENRTCINKSMNQTYLWWDNQQPPQSHQEDMGGFMINTYKNGNEASFVYNWLNIPSITSYFEYIDSMINVV